MDGDRNVNRKSKIATGRCSDLRLLFFFLAVLFFLFQGLSLCADSGDTAESRVVVDMAGRQVRIPSMPKKIACLDGPAYEKIFAFGAADRLALVPNVMLPWDYVLNPDLRKVPVLANFTAPDVEQLLSLGTDLVIFKPYAKPIERMTAAGIPVVVAYDGSRRQKTMEDFFQAYYRQIRFYGEILGKDSEAVAETYIRYMDKKIRKVLAVTEGMAEKARPRVFFYCGAANGPGDTQSRYTTAWWLVQAAGGSMMTVEDSSYFVSVSTEQMLLWNPEFILVSTGPSADSILENSQFRDIRAVREGKVFMSPQGVFYWTHFSTESYLLILYLAKQFHPELFPDLNVEMELKDYYEKFYHYQLTDDEAERIMNHLPPEAPPKS
jgi:iron complex transport system substrate-binding protein